ncbi:MAG: insulinase family protein [Planctomycetes bacterium]|nr:insulinase family protein [Planctomycetota bacterium]
MANATAETTFSHAMLPCGVELAADVLADRQTVAMSFRMLCGVADDPPELTGIGGIVERTLSKGTQRYDGQGLADAFDALGAQWGANCGRQSTLVRVVCLPEFSLDVIDLVGEMVARPTFPEEACEVAVQLAQEELTQLEDDPQALLQIAMQRVALGPVYGRNPGGEPETLPRITPKLVREHWKSTYAAGRLQVTAAGPIDFAALSQRVEEAFRGLGSPTRDGRQPCGHKLAAGRLHRRKDLKQQYIGISLAGAAKGDPAFPVEQLMLGVLAGGMSARLFTEVREKQGLVYWVSAWHEQPRGMGLIHLGASTTPERCEKTYKTLLRELARIGQDLSEEETERARNQIIAQANTEDDLTRARAGGLSDDLFHFGRPIGVDAKLDAIRGVTLKQVREYARQLKRDELCVATVGPHEL